MILELDVGNSRIKWRLLAADDLAVVGRGHVPGIEELQRVTDLDAAITMARMCSVRGGDVNQKLENWIRVKHEIDLVQGYGNPKLRRGDQSICGRQQAGDR